MIEWSDLYIDVSLYVQLNAVDHYMYLYVYVLTMVLFK